MHSSVSQPKKVFSFFLPPAISNPSWESLIHFLRLVAVGVLFLFIWSLSNNQVIYLGTKPITCLDIFWKLVVPIVPVILLTAPSLWRNICPLAAINIFGHSARTAFNRSRPGIANNHLILPSASIWLAKHGLYIAMSALFILVPARLLLFNDHSLALALLLSSLVVITFLFGLVFPFKSGWCSSICPVYSVEKAYGISPLIHGLNTLCRVESANRQNVLSCGGCTRNCLDLKLTNSNHKNSRWLPNASLKLFISIFPGFVSAYFLLSQVSAWHNLTPIFQVLLAYAVFTTIMLVSHFCYRYLTSQCSSSQESKKRLDLAFIVVSFNIYYLMAAPGLASTAVILLQLNLAIIPTITILFFVATFITSLYWLGKAW